MMKVKDPIANLEAEKSVLGLLLIWPELQADMPPLTAEDFFVNDNRKIFQAIQNVYNRKQSFDYVTLRAELKTLGDVFGDIGEYLEDLPLLLNCQDAEAPGQLIAHAELVRDKSACRKIEDMCREATRRLSSGENSEQVAAYLASANELIQGTGDIKRIGDIAKGLGDEEVQGIGTGHPVLDKLTGVGYIRGQLSVISAVSKNSRSTGARKSWFGIDAYRAAILGGHKSMYVTLADLSAQQVVRRVLKMQCGLGGRPKVQLDRVADWEEALKDMTDPYGDYSLAPVYDGPENGMTVEEVCVAMRKEKRRHGLDFAVIDYIQKLQSRSIPRSDRTRTLEYVSDYLKVFAAKEDIAMLVLSQLTIDKADGEKTMTQYSSAIEHDAALQIELRQTEHGATWFCNKNRFGWDQIKGSARWDQSHCRFVDFTMEAKGA